MAWNDPYLPVGSTREYTKLRAEIRDVNLTPISMIGGNMSAGFNVPEGFDLEAFLKESEERERPFDCPVSWCEGLGNEHREGPPENWLHTAPMEAFNTWARGNVFQTGSGPRGYYLTLNLNDEFTLEQLRNLAGEMKQLAAKLEERGEQL